jgi:3-dehydroquinate synthase
MKKLTCRVVKTFRSTIVAGSDWHVVLSKQLGPYFTRKYRVFILADSNTFKFCYPILISAIPGLAAADVLEITPGEEGKTIENAAKIWNWLSGHGADRRSLLINLGGGVVTDLGGFAATTFARGISFINIPTTLMGMADAATGGKNGVNLSGVKNQAGTFSFPLAVYIVPGFLATLDKRHLRSGFAEILKSALVADAARWRALKRLDTGTFIDPKPDEKLWEKFIFEALRVKNDIVNRDPFERKERKLLNFGHTIGHAFESLWLSEGTPVTHGEAVAMGMICEAWLSHSIAGLSQAALDDITGYITSAFGYFPVAPHEIGELVRLISHDKKNNAGTTRFTLISAPGQGVVNRECSTELVKESLEYYQSLDTIQDNT